LLITITSFGSLDDLFEIWTQNLLRIIKFSNLFLIKENFEMSRNVCAS